MISPVYNNLNKIDSVLKQEFGSKNVKLEHIEKRSGDGASFNFKFIIEADNYIVKMVIDGREALMMEKSINWSYFTNPTNEKSKLIKRGNSLDKLSSSVREVFNKKMFAKPYLESVDEMIKESAGADAEPILKRPLFKKGEDDTIEVSKKALEELLDNYGIVADDLLLKGGDQIDMHVYSKSMSGQPTSATIVNIETTLKEFEVVEMAWFTGSKLSIMFDGNVEMYD